MTHPPITPLTERFRQWEDDILNERDNVDHVLDCAWRDGFQAGADHELEMCCELFAVEWNDLETADKLRATRRPKPPSLKEQALDQLRSIQVDITRCGMGISVDTIRRALEALDD